jgi:5-methylcytosine-specific restriction protein B
MDAEVEASIAKALSSWDRDSLSSRVTGANALRSEFVERFPVSGWPDLLLESYALGQTIEGGTVCWWLEFKTRPVASMSGGSSNKHLIFRRSDESWKYPAIYASVEEAWVTIRKGFVDMLQMAEQRRFDEIDDIKPLAGANALRAKTTYMYFPDQILPVCSKEHLDHFLRELGEPASQAGAVLTNRQLLAALRAVPSVSELSTQELGYFLYHWADPRSAISVVKIAPGEQAKYWADCLKGSYICVGWDEVGDLTQFADKDEFREAFKEHYPYKGNNSQVSRKANEVWTMRELSAGDKVVANKGTTEVLAIGTVTEEGYQWRQERDDMQHTVCVNWDTSFAKSLPPVKAWATTTVAKVPHALYRTITGTGPKPNGNPPVDDDFLREIEEAVERKGQVILYGPPGTGKTFQARRAAVWLGLGGSAQPEAAAVLDDVNSFETKERDLSASGASANAVWFMVANPSHWPWKSLFTNGSVNYSLGRLKRNFPQVRAGDLVVGYESTPTLRVVALARVTSEFDPDGPADEALSLEPVTEVADGATYSELKADPILAQSEPLRFNCQGTLFALTAAEADRLLELLAKRDSFIVQKVGPYRRRLTRITFHPSYTYEDFVEGFRPRATAGGQLELALTDGVFKDLCAAAAASPDQRFILLIDEINRGNIPKVFGELITLIERDKRGLSVKLPQSGDEFAVPPNLVIIGTMNTADRSIHLLDAALRRRFAFVELLPDSQVLTGATAGALALDLFLDNLNEEVRRRLGREQQIGHALFYADGAIVATAGAFASAFRHELLPLLQEYFYEDYSSMADLLGDGVIDRDTARPRTLDPESLCLALAEQFNAPAGQ